MRDFRDAKTMAHSLRDALKAKAIEITHSDALEFIAKAFGYSNWNILSAKIASDKSDPAMALPPRCSFCGKSQHEVRQLITGPNAFICDGCIARCAREAFHPRFGEVTNRRANDND